MSKAEDELREVLGLDVPHLGPRGEMAQEAYDSEEMSEHLEVCLVCGGPWGLLGCLKCAGLE